MRVNFTEKRGIFAAITALAVSAVIGITSCGGGGGAPIVQPPAGGGGPAAGTANISGQLQEGSGGKVTSAVGDGLAGVLVQLINSVDGRLAGTTTTDLQGRYEFKGIPAGKQYLLKVEFTSSRDLNGNGLNDQVELVLPLNPADQATLTLLQQLGVTDSNGDGTLDAIRFENDINDDKGGRRNRNSEHRFRDGETVVDDNGNGSFGDDSPFDDSDCDGIRDDNGSGGSGGGGTDDSPGGLEREARGVITAISADSVTVGGQSFSLTTATRLMGFNNEAVGRDRFSVGTIVEVEGFSNGSGGWVAFKMKLEDDVIGGGGTGGGGGVIGDELEKTGTIQAISATVITVGGTDFKVTPNTVWRIDDNRNASPSLFTVGMLVEVTGDADGQGNWNARRVKTED